MDPRHPSILVLGAFGTFGRRIVAALAQCPELSVIAAGRRPSPTFENSGANVRILRLDSGAIDSGLLKQLKPRMIIDTIGPFQNRDRTVAAACIDIGIHYVDLADSGEFVRGVGVLHSAAVARNVLVVSGASTVPALSSAVIQELAQDFSSVEEIDIGIAPGYAAPRGLATIRSVLGYAGRSIPIWRNSRLEIAKGWSENRRHRYPLPVGVRNLALVDVPDTYLLPAQYPGLKRLSVRAGLELPLLHHGLRMLARLVSAGILNDLASHAPTMQRLAGWFDYFGSDDGSMHVCLQGCGLDGVSRTSTWTLVAEGGAGPQIPVTAAVLIAKRLLGVRGYLPLAIRGAMPALNLLRLQEFESAWLSLAIRTSRRIDVMRFEPRQDIRRLID